MGNISVLCKNIKQIVNGLLQRIGEGPLVFADDLRNTADMEILSCHQGKRLYGYKVDEKKRKVFEYFKKEEIIRLEQELDGVYMLVHL